MNVSSPDPRYFKDGAGLKPNWRFKVRHPRAYLRMKLMWRWDRLLRQLGVRKSPGPGTTRIR